MNRCLHLTFHENAAILPRRAPARHPGRGESDPGSNYVMPPVDDPGSNYVMPPVDDPGSNYVMPPVDDPGSNYIMPPVDDPDGVGYSFGTALVTAGSCCCCAPAPCPDATAPAGAAAPSPFVRPRDYSGFVIVRMARGIESPTARSLWRLAKELGLSGLRAVLELPGTSDEPGARREWCGKWRHLISRPLVNFPSLKRADELAQIRGLEHCAATSPFPPRHSLTAYWRLDLRKHPGLVDKVVEQLSRLAEVDLAYRELAAADPQTAAMDGKDFAEDQGYLADAPVGIGAAWIWHQLPTSSTSQLTLCDREQGWVLGHDDLPGNLPVLGDNRNTDEPGSGQHGTAVLGQLVATGLSQLGVKGAAAGIVSLEVASHYKAQAGSSKFPGTNGHVAEAIVRALAAATPQKPLDILLLEVQRGLLTTEVDEADFDAIRLATGNGVVVVEAAGNGGFDLDRYSDPDIRRSLRRGAPDFRDSGAILVGAARAAFPHDRAPFSNFGSRLDCFGWGETVTTCGFGDLAGNTDTNYYTNCFSGTSSAAPIVAGAAALLQSLHLNRTGDKLQPREMRALLADPATGTRQGPNVVGFIGVMPDLRAIVRDRLQLVPDVYLRRSPCDDGSAAGPHDEIGSSPDILVAPNSLSVKVLNRGLGEGEVDVQIFASPAATLITPERWRPVGSPFQIAHIPQGDTPFVGGPVSWLPPPNPPVKDWSFLAVLTTPGESPLPPGPPYFDWAEYRAFLRRPGVAWRNTYSVSAGNPGPLDFCIAGTPERFHVFDFEVVQRLPDGVRVELQVPDALAAKLRQRQPWLGGTGTPLTLPQRPRTPIRGVQLAAGACAAATFTVIDSNLLLGAGHSLALRQLWRGEEVGRITWIFV